MDKTLVGMYDFAGKMYVQESTFDRLNDSLSSLKF